MNDNISINDMLKNAAERAKKKAGLSSEEKKAYSNWDNYPKDNSKPFDFNKTTENLAKRLNDFSSTVSVKLAQSVSDLNDRVNNKNQESNADYSRNTEENNLFTEENLDGLDLDEDFINEYRAYTNKQESSKPAKENDVMKSLFDKKHFENAAESLRNAAQKARESEAFEKISKTLNDYKVSLSDALDESDQTMSETDGSNLFRDIKNSHSPVVVSGKEKGRVVQELSDAARRGNFDLEQIPMVLKDDISLRRLVSEIRENKSKNRVVVLDIVESPNAEQLRIFEKFVDDAKLGHFYLVILSDDEFSNSWFVINGAIQRIYDF